MWLMVLVLLLGGVFIGMSCILNWFWVVWVMVGGMVGEGGVVGVRVGSSNVILRRRVWRWDFMECLLMMLLYGRLWFCE